MQERLFELPNSTSNDAPSDPQLHLRLHANASHLHTALTAFPRCTFSALGSAPYVEADTARAHANVAHVFGLAEEHGLHVDFHLDYNLGEEEKGRKKDGEGLSEEDVREGGGAMVWEVLERVRRGAMGMGSAVNTTDGEEDRSRTLTIGHATRLTRFSHDAVLRLRSLISSLPPHVRVYFVALPQSDVYMMGRRPDAPFEAARGTLNVVRLVKTYGSKGRVGDEDDGEGDGRERGLEIAMSVNNVQNAFTPQGNVDPLGLGPVGVMLYQTGGEEDARIILVRRSFGGLPTYSTNNSTILTTLSTYPPTSGIPHPHLPPLHRRPTHVPPHLARPAHARPRQLCDTAWE
jgi:hypothetical protein